MNTSNVLQWMAHFGKWCGFIVIAYPVIVGNLTPKQAAIGTVIFTGASLLKDTVIKIGDLLDDGKQNDSFKIESK